MRPVAIENVVLPKFQQTCNSTAQQQSAIQTASLPQICLIYYWSGEVTVFYILLREIDAIGQLSLEDAPISSDNNKPKE